MYQSRHYFWMQSKRGMGFYMSSEDRRELVDRLYAEQFHPLIRESVMTEFKFR